MEIEERSGMLKGIKYRKVSPAEKVFALLRLLTSSVIPEGQLSEVARQIVRQTMRDADFMPSLMKLGKTGNDDDRERHSPQQLSTLLIQSGVNTPKEEGGDDGAQKKASA